MQEQQGTAATRAKAKYNHKTYDSIKFHCKKGGNEALKELARINYELAQMIVSEEDGKRLPEWFMIEIVRDLPRLVSQENLKNGKSA